MKHFQPYQSRTTVSVPTAQRSGWHIKRYAVIANQRVFDPDVASSALDAAIEQLPDPGKLENPNGNHGVGFQIVHFAEVAIVSPVFYWEQGSVLANTHQMRAPWDDSKNFSTGLREVVGCVWEMQIVAFETQSWVEIMLGGDGTPRKNLSRYLDCRMCVAEVS